MARARVMDQGPTAVRRGEFLVYEASADRGIGSIWQWGASDTYKDKLIIGQDPVVSVAAVAVKAFDFSEYSTAADYSTIHFVDGFMAVDSNSILQLPYSEDSADLVTCTETVDDTALTVTSLEDDIDGGFIYIVSGPGAGNLFAITASASGEATLDTDVNSVGDGDDLTTSSKFIKILPTKHPLAEVDASAGDIKSTAAAGSTTVVVEANYIQFGKGELHDLRKFTQMVAMYVGTDVTFYADIRITG